MSTVYWRGRVNILDRRQKFPCNSLQPHAASHAPVQSCSAANSLTWRKEEEKKFVSQQFNDSPKMWMKQRTVNIAGQPLQDGDVCLASLLRTMVGLRKEKGKKRSPLAKPQEEISNPERSHLQYSGSIVRHSVHEVTMIASNVLG